MVHAFPSPAKLAQLSPINGLNETKLQRAFEVSQRPLSPGPSSATAPEGHFPRFQALEELMAIPGIGPFFVRTDSSPPRRR